MRRPEIKSEAHYSVAENEVLLSFVNDLDALKFHDWINGDGWEVFQKWVEKHRKDYPQ